MSSSFRLHAERTPNPESIKWVLSQPVAPEGVSASFKEPVEADVSPLAARLFAVDGVVGVFFAANFITTTKREDVEWDDIVQSLAEAIKAFVTENEPPLGPGYDELAAHPQGDVVERIRKVLDDEIRPSVAMDGGDVIFAGFEDGVVEVYLQGACAGCPGASATLRFGIEARLREEVPEVTSVVSV
jgi:Fe-S cluster biogenesis protein NfuA